MIRNKFSKSRWEILKMKVKHKGRKLWWLFLHAVIGLFIVGLIFLLGAGISIGVYNVL